MKHAQENQRTESSAQEPDRIEARSFRKREHHPIARAFHAPAGILGKIAGFAMRKKNTLLNARAVELLGTMQNENVLEIGFGPGVSLKLLLERVGCNGTVVGVDISELMVLSTTRRLSQQMDTRNLILNIAPAHVIPWPDNSFEKVLSVSNVQFWAPANASFAEISRVLKPGGKLVLGIHTQQENQTKFTPGLYPDEVALLVRRMEHMGYTQVQTHTVSGQRSELCISARSFDARA